MLREINMAERQLLSGKRKMDFVRLLKILHTKIWVMWIIKSWAQERLLY